MVCVLVQAFEEHRMRVLLGKMEELEERVVKVEEGDSRMSFTKQIHEQIQSTRKDIDSTMRRLRKEGEALKQQHRRHTARMGQQLQAETERLEEKANKMNVMLAVRSNEDKENQSKEQGEKEQLDGN